MFGPPTFDPPNPSRPFGRASVDGFDFDFEREIPGMGEFGRELRRAMGGERKDGRLLTAAPMCTLPAENSMYNQIQLDMVFVQFYNNPKCHRDWNDWALRKNTMFAVGLPASSRAAGSGYVEPNELDNVLREAKSLGRMGGAMLWDASQAWSNRKYHTAVKKALDKENLRAGKQVKFCG